MSKKTIYWGVELSNDVYENETIKKFLVEHPELVPLPKGKPPKSIHTTLLFVGKKNNEKEVEFENLEGKECDVTIDAFGYSSNALALRVSDLKYNNDGTYVKCPSYPNHNMQHVTLALKEGVQPKDSVLALLPPHNSSSNDMSSKETSSKETSGTIVKFDLKLSGHIKRYV